MYIHVYSAVRDVVNLVWKQMVTARLRGAMYVSVNTITQGMNSRYSV